MKDELAHRIGGNARNGARLRYRIRAAIHERQIGGLVTVDRAAEAIGQLPARDRHVEKVAKAVPPRGQLLVWRFVVRIKVVVNARLGSRVSRHGIGRQGFPRQYCYLPIQACGSTQKFVKKARAATMQNDATSSP
ncbi:hypothetical protein [Paraburkholderia elongata]|uniref:Uncharacterized protein n=1 Tax=Paraburkholderia elongata TaxID=2675747 RepID=A0A972SI51_9BURK|nr:hypothetical protein [Paraburkholderia elongata]NPT55587.1 hypothetical protein [Paraburkholderia elongata]